ncbi:putative protein tincar isoform X3 [Penaeus vannamei]|uniref:Uncharacterized protein n=1 Tax=Penaeus vannamei TaxID=6689 RepID=A0A3R7Q2I0_PENVA|nr:putative protein tincar isoform X3 [Penaeus vannamei]
MCHQPWQSPTWLQHFDFLLAKSGRGIANGPSTSDCIVTIALILRDVWALCRSLPLLLLRRCSSERGLAVAMMDLRRSGCFYDRRSSNPQIKCWDEPRASEGHLCQREGKGLFSFCLLLPSFFVHPSSRFLFFLRSSLSSFSPSPSPSSLPGIICGSCKLAVFPQRRSGARTWILVPHNDRVAVLGANVTISPTRVARHAHGLRAHRHRGGGAAKGAEESSPLPEDGEWEPSRPSCSTSRRAAGLRYQLTSADPRRSSTAREFPAQLLPRRCWWCHGGHGLSSLIYFYGYQKFNSFLIKSKQRFNIVRQRAYANPPVRPSLRRPRGPGRPGSVPRAAPVGPLPRVQGLPRRRGPRCRHRDHRASVPVDRAVAAAHGQVQVGVQVARDGRPRVRRLRPLHQARERRRADLQRPQPRPHALLVVGAGKAYAITDATPKKSIMSVVQKDKRARGHQEEIYWLRPTQPALPPGKSMSPRAKVTFDEAGIMTSPRRARVNKSPKPQKSTYRRASTLSESEDEAGDYALLREGPENTTQQAAQEEDPRYVDRQQILAYRRAMEERLSSQPSQVSSVPDYEDHLQMRS